MFERIPRERPSLRERAAVLALVGCVKGDWHRVATLVDAAGSAVRLIDGHWEALEPDEIPLAEQLSHAVTGSAISEHEATVDRLEREGTRVITVLDDDYPMNLRMVFNKPPVLFVRGGLEAGQRRLVAVVGTREPSSTGIKRTRDLVHELVALGFEVVSGLARGVDAAAHRAALAADGRTIAVLGSGLNRVYPPEHGELAGEIARQGALVSQFWPDTPPTKHTFPLRNAVLSGLSAGVVVVEGSPRSGSSMQARIAFNQARPVFFVNGLSAGEEWARHYLEQGVGRVISSAEEIGQATRLLTGAIDQATLS
jgi:DNA processing protein